jgi:hypothetical protein
VQTLRQIDIFCANTIAKYDPGASHRVSSFGQNFGSSAALPNSSLVAPPISNFASASLVKSLNYVRSLVARHIPKLSFQPIPQSVSSASTKQPLPSLSSFLNKSLIPQLNPEVVTNREHLESKESHTLPDLISSASEKVDGGEHGYDIKYISFDILNWRWHVYGERQASSSAKERYNFLLIVYSQFTLADLNVLPVENSMCGAPVFFATLEHPSCSDWNGIKKYDTK